MKSIIRHKGHSGNNSLFVVRENEACWFAYSRLCLQRVALSADLGLVDRVRGSAKWIQHGTVLADWWNTRADNAAAGSWPAVAGPNIPRIMYRTFLLCLVLLCLSFVLGGRVRQIR